MGVSEKLNSLRVYAQGLRDRLKGDLKNAEIRLFLERDLRKTEKKIEDLTK